jgi:hypothetical protein
MTPLHQDLFAILEAVVVESPRRFVVLGDPHEIADGGPSKAEAGPSQTRLESDLAAVLYQRMYIRPVAVRRIEHPDALGRRDLVSALSAANTGRGTWEPGWAVCRIDDAGQVVVAKDGVEFWVDSESLRTADGVIGQGQACRVWVANERRELMPSYYFALGDQEEETRDGREGAEPMDRYFWHLTADAAVRFMASATTLLNEAQIPFSLKVPSDPSAYYRADAGVLYVQRRFRQRTAAIIARIYAAVSAGLRPDVPRLTKWLASGLAFAEDPTGSMSFGQHRCQLIAVALCESFRRGEIDVDARSDTMAQMFSRDGLDALRPYLGPGSTHEPEPEPLQGEEPVARVDSARPSGCGWAADNKIRPAPLSPLEVAVSIGLTVCASAVWNHEGRLCNWMGRSSDELTDPGGPITPASAALGPDLYAGSAGVALFLAQVHALTGEPQFGRTAVGAIDRSVCQLGRASRTPRTSALSFFLGHFGVVHAAQRIAAMLGDDSVLARAQGILDQATQVCCTPHILDLLGGSAGAIPSLLTLSRTPGLEHCLELATSLGEELCQAALRQSATCTWDPNTASGPGMASTPLTGLSHGAAGIGLALFELHAATGRLDFLETARGAFAYEDSLLDPHRGNWPDFRSTGRTGVLEAESRFATAWCHGAPGIALTRFRAAALDPTRADDYLAMARIAIGTTLTAIDENLENPRADASLCHGLAGLLDIILIAGEILGEPAFCSRAEELAQALIDRHAAPGDWPSGAPSGGPNPSLMLGSAGVGYAFLRLHDPESVPSVLLLTP